MSKKQYVMMIDTETAGSVGYPLPYDVGFAVADLQGNLYEPHSFVNGDIYCGERELMKTAYYAEKLPQYEADLRDGKRKMTTFFKIRKTFYELYHDYGCLGVAAYNTGFDRRSMNNGFAHATEGRCRYFFKKDMPLLDVWTMACNSIFKTRTFRRAAYDNGWYSEKGNVRTNAEVAFAYISGQHEFTESHTALEDVMIEAEIMAYCWKRTDPEQRGIVGCPWRIPQGEWYYTEDRLDRA